MIETNKVIAKIVIRCDKSCEKNGKIGEIILNSKMFRSMFSHLICDIT